MSSASLFADRHADDYERKVTAKRVGILLRKKLNLRPWKSNGVFVISASGSPKLVHLYEKYGISDTTQEPEAVRPADAGFLFPEE